MQRMQKKRKVSYIKACFFDDKELSKLRRYQKKPMFIVNFGMISTVAVCLITYLFALACVCSCLYQHVPLSFNEQTRQLFFISMYLSISEVILSMVVYVFYFDEYVVEIRKSIGRKVA